MAVYTEVSEQEAGTLLLQLQLGQLMTLQGCSGGIENTNYFVTTELAGQRRELVLTLFERLSFEQLPFYLRLMKHLALRGIPVPDPSADRDGDLVFSLKGKPTAVVERLRGSSELQPRAVHCAAVGDMLARMHLAGRDFELRQPNLRGLDWWRDTVPVVLPYLNPAQAELIQSELAYQVHVAQGAYYAALPRGPIRARRENSAGGGKTRVSCITLETLPPPADSAMNDRSLSRVSCCLASLVSRSRVSCQEAAGGLDPTPPANGSPSSSSPKPMPSARAACTAEPRGSTVESRPMAWAIDTLAMSGGR
jgi:hypothetical protein